MSEHMCDGHDLEGALLVLAGRGWLGVPLRTPLCTGLSPPLTQLVSGAKEPGFIGRLELC